MNPDAWLEEWLDKEIQRQSDGLELIPSENYVSGNVLKALGSVYTNKYSEGYPGRRYYGGQVNMDAVETEAIELAKALFRADHANIQALSGAAANAAVYLAWLEPGDTVLGMDLSHGGHLTHGAPVTHMSKLYNFVRYKMKDVATGELDYGQIRALARQHRPKIILAGFSAYPRTLDWAKLADIAEEAGALAMADVAHIGGFIAAGLMANPLEAGFHVMTTTTHKSLRGPRGALILSRGRAGNPLKNPDKTLENLPTLIDRSVFPGLQGGPHMNNVFAIAVALREAKTPQFKTYAEQTLANAAALADALKSEGFKLVTGGTDNHLILADTVSSFGLDGAEVEKALDQIGLTVNKNPIPDDANPPFRPSGIRLGTPAATTRGLKPEHMIHIARWMKLAIENKDDQTELASLGAEVRDFLKDFPPPA
jgi:glycine hydroxymethyltransferase